MRILGRDNWTIDFYEDWSQLFQKCNWYSFRFADIAIDKDNIVGDLTVDVMILGVGFSVFWHFADTPEFKKIQEQAKSIQKELEGFIPKT
jgi:hypothetical protein